MLPNRLLYPFTALVLAGALALPGEAVALRPTSMHQAAGIEILSATLQSGLENSADFTELSSLSIRQATPDDHAALIALYTEGRLSGIHGALTQTNPALSAEDLLKQSNDVAVSGERIIGALAYNSKTYKQINSQRPSTHILAVSVNPVFPKGTVTAALMNELKAGVFNLQNHASLFAWVDANSEALHLFYRPRDPLKSIRGVLFRWICRK